MTTNTYLEQLDQQNFHIEDNVAYGHINGYPLVIVPQAYNTAKIFNVMITLAAELHKQQSNELRYKAKAAGIKVFIRKNILSYTFKKKQNDDINALCEQINAITSILRQNGVTPPNTCYLCAQSNPDIYIQAFSNAFSYNVAHSACVEKKQAEITNKAAENTGNYFTGILGACLGAVVGMIPALLGILILNVVSAWLFMLIPIATYYGYKLFKGKMDIAAPICSVVFSLAGLAFMLMALVVILSMSIGFSFSEAVYYMSYYTFKHFSLDYWSWLGSDFVKIIVFYLIGVLFSLGIIRRTNMTEVKSFHKVLKTKMPYKSTELY